MQPVSGPTGALADGGVTTLDEVVERMIAIDSALRLGNGVRYFNTLYLEVTRDVVKAVRGDELEEPRFLEQLAVFFANAYFRAVDDFDREPASVSRAWAPLFQAQRDRRVAPIQFALAGMNAHINYDLPIGVRETCRAFDVVPGEGTPQHRDYVRLNAILADVLERVKVWLATGMLGVLDRAFGRLDDVVAIFSVARARDTAWAHATTLWYMRDEPELTSAYLPALERTVGFAGRGLLAPTLLGLGRWASSQTWLPRSARLLLGAPRLDR